MIAYSDIRNVHLEISSLCNASCAWCPRTFWGYPYNDGYPETNLSLAQAQHIFTPEFLQQLMAIEINGNFGDIVMNPQGAEIVSYFVEQNPLIEITVSTNGAARNAEFWQSLAQSGAIVSFCLDGLEDTHHLYRQNTVWHTVIKNAQTFIAQGGHAIWKMIRFDHNLHQIEQCRHLSQELGFARFDLIDQGRDTAPVFNKQGELTHVLGNYTGIREFPVLFHKKKTDTVLLEDIVQDRSPKQKISCEAQRMGQIYIAANGDVSPCCYTGFYPRSFGHGQYHQAANAQLVPLMHNHNALAHSLEQCLDWFNGITGSWNKNTYESGRLVICDDYCGSN